MVREESQLYRDLMRFKPDGWSPNAWAVAAGVSRTVWTDMRRHGNPARRTLEKLLTAAGSSLAEFEALRIGDTPMSGPSRDRAGVADTANSHWRRAALPPLPLVAAENAGAWVDPDSELHLTEARMHTIIGTLPRPQSLAGDPGAYALVVLGESMLPRFRPGRNIAISPRAAPKNGDDVFAILTDDRSTGVRTGLIGELVSTTAASVELRFFTPGVTVQLPSDRVKALHLVAGEILT